MLRRRSLIDAFARDAHGDGMRARMMRDGDDECTGVAVQACLFEQMRVCDKSVIAEVLALRLTCLFLSARFTRTPRPPQLHPTLN